MRNNALCQEDHPGRTGPLSSTCRTGICTIDRIKVVNDWEGCMNCSEPRLDCEFYFSEAANVVMFRKKESAAEGEKDYRREPAGTGRHELLDRSQGQQAFSRPAPTPSRRKPLSPRQSKRL